MAFNLATAEACGFCAQPVGVKIEGKFEGAFHRTDDGKVHAECYDAYRLAKAPKCFLCLEPVTSVGGKFSGRSYNIEGQGKLHSECYDRYQTFRGR